ncbi:hypothetical protein [Tellurirhabdus bombi]|uniref:hypothetical protein n=1 Tax=Tellurirhabdus bombi TaxID=2907205 RepID=UPI001F226960|nr:hypothetical protein [Tellurirhabdus bombi]
MTRILSVICFLTWLAQPASAQFDSISRPAPVPFRATYQIYAGTQLPFQHVAGVEVRPIRQFSVFGQVGFPSVPYTKWMLTHFSPENRDIDYKYVRDNLQSSISYGVGGRLHLGKWRVSGWWQRLNYKVDGTPKRLVEAFAPDQARTIENITSALRPILPGIVDFYENQDLTPTGHFSQVGLSAGRTFYIPQVPRLSISTDLGVLYSARINTKVDRLEPAFLREFAETNILPLIDEEIKKQFESRFIPTLSISVAYQIR